MNEDTTAGFWAVFWPRVDLVAGWVGIPVLLVGLTVWWATRRRRGGGGVSGESARRARVGRLAGLGAGALVGVVAVWGGHAWFAPGAVAGGYLLGVAAGELSRYPAPRDPVRVASLEVREPARYVPKWAALIASAASVVTVLAPVVFAAVPRVRYGPWRPDPGYPQPTLPGGTLSWPSAGLTISLAAIAAGALLAGACLVQRVTQLPAPITDRPGLNESARHNAARAIAGVVVGVELLTLGTLAIAASDGLAVPGAASGYAYLGSRALIWTGLGLALTGITTWCVLGWWHRGRHTTNHTTETSPA